jgi:hypothetical protein
MTREIAIGWQEKLFPRQLHRIYIDHETPAPPSGGSWIGIPPTLCKICLDLRASVSGAADPWERSRLLEVKSMFQARVDTWRELGGRDDFVLIDNLVKQMVEATIRIADEQVKTRNW